MPRNWYQSPVWFGKSAGSDWVESIRLAHPTMRSPCQAVKWCVVGRSSPTNLADAGSPPSGSLRTSKRRFQSSTGHSVPGRIRIGSGEEFIAAD